MGSKLEYGFGLTLVMLRKKPSTFKISVLFSVLTKIFTDQHPCISTANHASTVFKPIQLPQDKSILRFQFTS